MFIPIPWLVILPTPPLIAWWSHRRAPRREYGILVTSILAVMSLQLFLLAQRVRS